MPPGDAAAQVWQLTVDGRVHRVEAHGSWPRRVRWYVDDRLAAETRSGSEKVRLTDRDGPGLAAVEVRFNRLGAPRRATLTGPRGDSGPGSAARGATWDGGLDLAPEPGSAAAEHEERVRTRPRRHAALAALGGVVSVVLPLVLVALLARFAMSLPLPDWDLPAIPVPDLPSIAWPDLPDVPWPDWSLPGWATWLLSHASYVWPVVLAVVLAHAEVRRRATQDRLRAARTESSSRDVDDEE